MVVIAAPQRAHSTTIHYHDDAEQPAAAGTPQPKEKAQSARAGLHLSGADDRDCDCGACSLLALPNFLGTRDKAAAGAQIGSLQVAKQCSTISLGEGLTTDEVLSAGGTMSTVCTGSATPVTIKNTTGFTAGRVTGLTCGRSPSGVLQTATSDDKFCTFTIDADGVITGLWSTT